MTHSDTVRAILAAISPYGLCWPNNTGAFKDATGRLIRYGCKGSPDILATIKSFSVHIEVKVGKDRQSVAQINFQAAQKKAGGVYIIASSPDDAIAQLKALGVL